MDSQTMLDKYSPILKRHWPSLVLALLGLIFLGYGLIALIGGASKSSSDVVFEAGNDSNLSSTAVSPKASAHDIVVDVEGEVLRPGVYHVSSDSRVRDGLIAAGGLSENADRNWVTKNLNLAVRLRDGAKIYILKIGEMETEGIKGIKGFKGGDAEDKININTASEQTLESLPGVGPATAQKIINGRPYSSIDELLSRKTVGSKVFEEIKEKISVY